MSRSVMFLRQAVLCLPMLCGAFDVDAQTVAPQDTVSTRGGAGPNVWTARSNTGRTLNGTWTAVPDSTGETVMGTWTLLDAQNRTVATGGWSAAKSRDGWLGAWRAIIAVSNIEYSGTWRSSVNLRGSAGFADLFAKAAQDVVSGEWRTGRYSGAWSIRVY